MYTYSIHIYIIYAYIFIDSCIYIHIHIRTCTCIHKYKHSCAYIFLPRSHQRLVSHVRSRFGGENNEKNLQRTLAMKRDLLKGHRAFPNIQIYMQTRIFIHTNTHTRIIHVDMGWL